MKKVVKLNVISTFFLQIVTIISGFIVPKIILSIFGSEVNGLISSINQFLSYIMLLEGGLSGVVLANLYKPLEEQNYTKVSSIIKTTKAFFKKIGFFYVVYVAVLSIFYPIITRCGYTRGYVAILIWVLAMNLLIQYFLSLTYQLLLRADQKVYVVSLTQSLVVILNVLLTWILSKIVHDVIWIKLGSGMIYFIYPIVFTIMVNKYYQLDKNASLDNNSIAQRWDAFGQNLAFFIHTNTDIVILTFFVQLTIVSVYSVYMMIINALKNLILSISNALTPTLGNIISKENNQEIHDFFDRYEFFITFVSTLFYSAGLYLIVPFVGVYTSDIVDANYIQPVFAIVMILAELIYCLRDPYIAIVYAYGHFKQTKKYAYNEAIINIVLSLLLVKHFGLLGVAIGTLVAMLYRMIAHIIYVDKNLLERRKSKYIKVLVFALCNLASSYVINTLVWNSNVEGYFSWFILGIKAMIVIICILGITSFVFYKKYLFDLYNVIVGKLRGIR